MSQICEAIRGKVTLNPQARADVLYKHREEKLALAQPLMLCQPLPVTSNQANTQYKQIKDATLTYLTFLI